MPKNDYGSVRGAPAKPFGWLASLGVPGVDRFRHFDGRFFLIFQVLFWTASAVSLKVMIKAFLPVDEANWIIFNRILTGLLMTSLLHLVYQSTWMRRMGGRSQWGLIFFLNLAFCLLGAAFWLGMIALGAPELPSDSPFLSIFTARLYSLLFWNTAYFGLIFILNYHFLKLEAAEAKLATRSSELQHLQSQLNPHFLFNTLTLLQNRIGPASPGQEVIQMLSEHLRYSLAQSKPLEPLGIELDALEPYLELQRARFAGQIDCFIKASPAASKALAPPMLVQPLLENAFKFGPRSSRMPLHVAVTASIHEEELQIDVTNSGHWISEGGEDSTGTGLANLRRRLFLLLGESARLEIFKNQDSVSVKICLPLRAR